MSNIRVDVIGFDKLTDQLKKLADDKDKKRETLAILRMVARPTVQSAKQLVPVSPKAHWVSGKRTKKLVQPGSLRKSIGLITGRKAKNPTIYAGPRAKGSFDGWYGHFVHDGHAVYQRGFRRKRTAGANNSAGIKSRTKAMPFMTNAYKATDGVVTADAEKRMAAFIQKKIDKLS